VGEEERDSDAHAGLVDEAMGYQWVLRQQSVVKGWGLRVEGLDFSIVGGFYSEVALQK